MMHFRVKTQGKFAGREFARGDPFFFGVIKKHTQADISFLSKRLDAFDVKISSAVKSDKFASKKTLFRDRRI